MAYQIKYAYTCHIGKIRNNNEDNFWCCGEFLNAQNQGMSHIQSGCRKQSELPVMAVFDGMGGESCGEMAAFLAAESCGMHYKEQKDLIGSALLRQLSVLLPSCQNATALAAATFNESTP